MSEGVIQVKSWDKRTHEVAYLLNPAFCGRILYSTIKTYSEKTHFFWYCK